MPDEPKNLPTFEDALRDLGEEKMTFFSEMVEPDPPKASEQEE